MIFDIVALATDPHQTQRRLAVDFRILGHGIFFGSAGAYWCIGGKFSLSVTGCPLIS